MIRFNHHLLGWFLQEIIGINTTFIGVLGGRMPWEIRLFWWLKPLQSLDYLGFLGWWEFTGNLYRNIKNPWLSASACPKKTNPLRNNGPGLHRRSGVIQQFVQVLIAHDENIDPERSVTVWDLVVWFLSFFFGMGSAIHPSIHPSIFPDLLRSYLESNSISSPPMKSYPILPIHPAIVIYAHISVVNPITNHPQYHHFYGCYKPSPTSRFTKIGFIFFDFRQYTFYITHPKKCILGGVHPLKIYISRS